MFKREAVVFVFSVFSKKKKKKDPFTTVHHHAFSYLVETEEMKMGIQTAQEACVDSLERPRPGCSAHKATPLQLYYKLKPSEK